MQGMHGQTFAIPTSSADTGCRMLHWSIWRCVPASDTGYQKPNPDRAQRIPESGRSGACHTYNDNLIIRPWYRALCPSLACKDRSRDYGRLTRRNARRGEGWKKCVELCISIAKVGANADSAEVSAVAGWYLGFRNEAIPNDVIQTRSKQRAD
jgi:hypothetical protein